QSSGQGHETSFAMVVADTLGIELERVRVKQSPLDKALVGNHTGGSRSLAGAGSICKVAALKAIEECKNLAAVELGVEPSQVDYANGMFSARETGRSIGFGELAQKQEAAGSALNVLGEGSVGSTF